MMTSLAELSHQGLGAWLEGLRPRLTAVLKSYSIPVEDAEDLLQQALVVLVYRRETLRYPDRWLLGVLRKKCLMYWRSRRRRRDQSVDCKLLDWLSKPARPAQEWEDQLRDLSALLSRLSPRCRCLIRLRFQMGLEPGEVARRMGYRPTSIAKLTSRCLAELSAQAASSAWPESLQGKRPGARL